MNIERFVSSLNDEEILELEFILSRNKKYITIVNWIKENPGISARLKNSLFYYIDEFQCKYIDQVRPYKLLKIRNAGVKVVNEFREIMNYKPWT